MTHRIVPRPLRSAASGLRSALCACALVQIAPAALLLNPAGGTVRVSADTGVTDKDDGAFAGAYVFFGTDFFGEDLANIAGAIAAAAAIVATGGTGAPLVLAVMAAGLEIGAKVGAELGLDPKIAMAIGLAGAALGLCTGNAEKLGSIQALANDVRAVATVVQGSATAAGGVSGAIAQDEKSDALELYAQVSFARGLEDDVTLEIDDAIAALEDALSRQTRATSVASSVTRAEEVANRNVAANIGGPR